MKAFVFALTAWFCIATPASGSDRLSVEQTDLDSLKLNYSVDELLGFLENKLSDLQDRNLIVHTSLKILDAYYAYRSTKQELQLLRIERDNLRRIYHLYLRKQKTAQATDLEVFSAHNALLSRELAIISKEAVVRGKLIELAKLCNMDVRYANR